MPVAAPAPCPTCLQLICSDTADTALYSIEASLFPFVLNCPPGFDCGGADSFNMLCCGQLLSVTFPPGASADQKTTLIQGLVNQCATILPLCNQFPGCKNPPCTPPPPPTQLFYNRPQSCSAPCPDGTVFTYTVPAGTFAALTQALADQEALAFACKNVTLLRVCLGNFPSCLCVGMAYSKTIPKTGGLPPFIFTLASGSLPTGLVLSASGTISGTPTVSGNFTFSVMLLSGNGGSITKSYTMAVLEITTTVLDAFSIGVPYDFQLLAAGGSGNYAWKIVSGTLPPGLVMDNTGHITGTPT